jgi:hypothetical protein
MDMSGESLVSIGVGSVSGSSEALEEQRYSWLKTGAQITTESIKYLLSPILSVSAPPSVRYLSQSEQRILKKALYRSTRVVHKA